MEKDRSELSLDDKIMDFRYSDDVKSLYDAIPERERANDEIKSLIKQLRDGNSVVLKYIFDHYTNITQDFIKRHFTITNLNKYYYILEKLI